MMLTGTRIEWTYSDGWQKGVTYTEVTPDLLTNWAQLWPDSLFIIKDKRFVFISETDMNRLIGTGEYNDIIGMALKA